MRLRFAGSDQVQPSFAPTFKRFAAAAPIEKAAVQPVEGRKMPSPALLVEFFGLGWVCGFAAGAGLVAVLLQR